MCRGVGPAPQRTRLTEGPNKSAPRAVLQIRPILPVLSQWWLKMDSLGLTSLRPDLDISFMDVLDWDKPFEKGMVHFNFDGSLKTRAWYILMVLSHIFSSHSYTCTRLWYSVLSTIHWEGELNLYCIMMSCPFKFTACRIFQAQFQDCIWTEVHL